MPSNALGIRLSDQERGLLEGYASSAGVPVSTLARRVLREFVGLDTEVRSEVGERLADLDRRLSRLEEMAGL